jgi:hypothetical protein
MSQLAKVGDVMTLPDRSVAENHPLTLVRGLEAYRDWKAGKAFRMVSYRPESLFCCLFRRVALIDKTLFCLMISFLFK